MLQRDGVWLVVLCSAAGNRTRVMCVLLWWYTGRETAMLKFFELLGGYQLYRVPTTNCLK